MNSLSFDLGSDFNFLSHTRIPFRPHSMSHNFASFGMVSSHIYGVAVNPQISPLGAHCFLDFCMGLIRKGVIRGG